MGCAAHAAGAVTVEDGAARAMAGGGDAAWRVNSMMAIAFRVARGRLP
jgi:hypothetical protein